MILPFGEEDWLWTCALRTTHGRDARATLSNRFAFRLLGGILSDRAWRVNKMSHGCLVRESISVGPSSQTKTRLKSVLCTPLAKLHCCWPTGVSSTNF